MSAHSDKVDQAIADEAAFIFGRPRPTPPTCTRCGNRRASELTTQGAGFWCLSAYASDCLARFSEKHHVYLTP